MIAWLGGTVSISGWSSYNLSPDWQDTMLCLEICNISNWCSVRFLRIIAFVSPFVHIFVLRDFGIYRDALTDPGEWERWDVHTQVMMSNYYVCSMSIIDIELFLGKRLNLRKIELLYTHMEWTLSGWGDIFLASFIVTNKCIIFWYFRKLSQMAPREESRWKCYKY